MTSVQPPRDPEEPESAASRASRNRLEALRTAGQLGSLGMSFALAVVLGAALGAWLDRSTGWGPVLFISGFFLGLAAGILNVIRILKVTK